MLVSNMCHYGAVFFVSLQVKERPDVGVYVKDLSTFVVKNPEQMDKIMNRGAKNRTLTFAVFMCVLPCSCLIFARRAIRYEVQISFAASIVIVHVDVSVCVWHIRTYVHMPNTSCILCHHCRFPHTYVGAVGVTDMNDHSSRSHTIFTITVERCELGADRKQHVRMGKLHLVDLAVSACAHGETPTHAHCRWLSMLSRMLSLAR